MGNITSKTTPANGECERPILCPLRRHLKYIHHFTWAKRGVDTTQVKLATNNLSGQRRKALTTIDARTPKYRHH